MEAPGGRSIGLLRIMWAISAHTCRVRRSFAARVSSHVAGSLPWTAAKAVTKDLGERFPLDHP